MSRGVRLLVGLALVLHGLAHALPGMRALDHLAGWPVGAHGSGSPLLVMLGTALWATATVGLMGAGFGAWGVRPLRHRWPFLALSGAGASLLLLLLFRPYLSLPGIVLSAGIVLAFWASHRRGAGSGEPGGWMGGKDPAPSRGRGGPVRWAMEVTVLLFLLWVTLAIVTRPWHMRWGSTDAELALSLPGDELVAEPVRYGIQHAVTIRAPTNQVWPWLVQLGQDRAGFYSYDWLERLFGVQIHNVGRIVPEWQTLAAGDSVFATQPGYLGIFRSRLGWRVAQVDPGRAVVLEKWGAFVLEAESPDITRFIIRTRGGGPVAPLEFLSAPAGLLLFEIPHFIMQRRMLLGIRALAEGGTVPRDDGPPGPPDRPAGGSPEHLEPHPPTRNGGTP
jgi:hypothetical protein